MLLWALWGTWKRLSGLVRHADQEVGNLAGEGSAQLVYRIRFQPREFAGGFRQLIDRRQRQSCGLGQPIGGHLALLQQLGEAEPDH